MTRKLIISKRILLYLLWYVFAVILASFIFDVIWGSNSQGDSCNVALWKYGELYQALDGKPCVFTGEFYFSAYISYLILYLLFDIVRCKILAKNPSVLWRIGEIAILFFVYWFCAVYNWRDVVILYSSFLGCLCFFIPFFVLAIVLKLVRYC